MPASEASEPVSSFADVSSCCVFLPLWLQSFAGQRWRERLDHVEPVGAAEEREEVLGVIREDRQLALLRQLPGEDRGHGVLGVWMHGRRAAVPRRVPRERREVREARCVHVLSPVHERDRRELVEDDQHDRCLRADGDRRGVRVLREDELGHRRVEQEENEEDDRRCGKNREEALHGRHARVQSRDPAPGERRREERAEAGQCVGLRQRVKHDDGNEPRHEDEVQ